MLRLQRLRELTLESGHLSAASGLVAVAGRLYVIADDALHLGVFPAAGSAPGELVRILAGDLPADPVSRKAAKPDFETLCLLPARAGRTAGELLALGSGSRPRRRLAALVPLDDSGAVRSQGDMLDLAAVMAAMEQQAGELNLEGAVVQGPAVRLLQRGNRGRAANGVFDMRLDDLLAGKPRGIRFRAVDLGSVDGVPLGFTDGASLAGGALLFTAVAEDTATAYDDAPCTAAAIGVLAGDGTLLHLERLDGAPKVEGVAVTETANGLRMLLVTDADDPAVPAVLYEAAMPDWGG